MKKMKAETEATVLRVRVTQTAGNTGEVEEQKEGEEEEERKEEEREEEEESK